MIITRKNRKIRRARKQKKSTKKKTRKGGGGGLLNFISISNCKNKNKKKKKTRGLTKENEKSFWYGNADSWGDPYFAPPGLNKEKWNAWGDRLCYPMPPWTAAKYTNEALRPINESNPKPPPSRQDTLNNWLMQGRIKKRKGQYKWTGPFDDLPESSKKSKSNKSKRNKFRRNKSKRNKSKRNKFRRNKFRRNKSKRNKSKK